MLRYCLYWSLVLIAFTNAADDCTDQINKLQECVNQKRQDRKALSDANKDKLTTDGLACFKANKCQEPTPEALETGTPPPRNEKEGKSKSNRGHRKESNFGGPEAEKRRECYKQISEKAKADVEKCVQAKMPSFKFPAKRNNKNKRVKNRQQGMNIGHLIQFVNDSCSEPSRESTMKCLQDSFKKRSTGNPDERRMKAEQRFNQTCADKDACFKQLSIACQTQLNETKKATCDCAKLEYRTKNKEFEREYITCSGVTDPPNTSGPPVKSAQYRGSGLENFVDNMCKNRDPCATGFKDRKGKTG